METEQYTFVHILDPGRADGAGDGDSGVRPGSAAPGKEDRLAILALALVPGGSPTSVRRLVRDHAPATVVRAPANLLDNADLTDQDRAFLERLIAASPERLMVEAARQGDLAEQHSATILTFHDPGYPSNLREVGEAPPVLFVQGTLDAEKDSLSAAVVGTREASGDGLFRARKVAKMLVERDVVVVSGLARGIDTAAHRATLDAGGRTHRCGGRMRA